MVGQPPGKIICVHLLIENSVEVPMSLHVFNWHKEFKICGSLKRITSLQQTKHDMITALKTALTKSLDRVPTMEKRWIQFVNVQESYLEHF